jgi:hypothetical protein
MICLQTSSPPQHIDSSGLAVIQPDFGIAAICENRTKAQMFEAIAAAVDKNELPAMEPGAMCYMMSKQGYLSDRDGHWHPHLMFFVSQTDPAAWGADLPGSPIVAFKDTVERVTVFLIPVRVWSDGTADR